MRDWRCQAPHERLLRSPRHSGAAPRGGPGPPRREHLLALDRRAPGTRPPPNPRRGGAARAGLAIVCATSFGTDPCPVAIWPGSPRSWWSARRMRSGSGPARGPHVAFGLLDRGGSARRRRRAGPGTRVPRRGRERRTARHGAGRCGRGERRVEGRHHADLLQQPNTARPWRPKWSTIQRRLAYLPSPASRPELLLGPRCRNRALWEVVARCHAFGARRVLRLPGRRLHLDRRRHRSRRRDAPGAARCAPTG